MELKTAVVYLFALATLATAGTLNQREELQTEAKEEQKRDLQLRSSHLEESQGLNSELHKAFPSDAASKIDRELRLASQAGEEPIHRQSRQTTVEERLDDLEATVAHHTSLIQFLQTELINERARVMALENETAILKAENADLDSRVVNQAALIQLLQFQQANSTARLDTVELAILDLYNQTASGGGVGGGVQNPVSFTVRFSHDDDALGVPIGPREILKFDWVAFNIGEGYNPATGLFTAPVSGVYMFYLTLMGANQKGQVELAITDVSSVLALVYAEGSTDSRDQGSTQVSTYLAAGQHVWVRQELGDAVRGNWWTTFTGYLLHEDSPEVQY